MPNFEPTSEDIEKLPKWAQNYIYLLRSKADNLQGQLNAHGDPNAKITWSYGFDGKEHGLPDRATITMHFGPRKKYNHIDLSLRDDHLIVNGSKSIGVYPSGGSNSILITLKK